MSKFTTLWSCFEMKIKIKNAIKRSEIILNTKVTNHDHTRQKHQIHFCSRIANE